MSKRLTDTAKWKNPWFRKLPTKFKLLFLYILDECDNAGVMHLDYEIISFVLSEQYLDNEFRQYLGEKVHYIAADKIIIKNFITYQKNNDSKMWKHLESVLRGHNILDAYNAGSYK